MTPFALSIGAVALSVAALVLSGIALLRSRVVRAPASVPTSKPTTATHRIAAFRLDGKHMPDVYIGDDDHEVKRKWDALKKRQGSGHFELWHAKHGKRDEFTRRLASLR